MKHITMSAHSRGRTALGRLAVGLAVLACLGAGVVSGIQVTGKVLYRSSSATLNAGAEVDLDEVFANNPAYMRIEALGLSPATGHGKQLFNEASRAAKKALATVADANGLDVITMPGGLQSDAPVENLTDAVIEDLPVYCIDGLLLDGSQRALSSVAEMDRTRVWEAIPAYVAWRELDEGDADYYFLKEEFESTYLKAMRRVERDQGISAVIELGGVTSRLDPPPDITDQVIGVLED